MKEFINDYLGNAIVVGKPEDWYLRDEDGEIISVNAQGEPVAYQPLWEQARSTGNGVMPNGYTVGGSTVATANGYGFHSPEEQLLRMRKAVNYMERDGHGVDNSSIYEQGHSCENQVAEMGMAQINKRFMHPHGLWGVLIDDQRMFQAGQRDSQGNLKYPHCFANMDRIIEVHEKTPRGKVLGYYLMEVKTVQMNGFQKPMWTKSEKNKIGQPLKYLDQQMFYMGICTNLLGSFICAGQDGALRTSDDILIRYTPADREKSEELLQIAESFAQYAETKKDITKWKKADIKNLTEIYGQYAITPPEDADIYCPDDENEIIEAQNIALEYLSNEIISKKKADKKKKCEEVLKKHVAKMEGLLLKKVHNSHTKVLFNKGDVLPNGKTLKENAYVHILCEPKVGLKERFRVMSYDAEGVKKNLPELWKKVGHIFDGEPVIVTSGVKLTAAEKNDLSPYEILGRTGKMKIKVYIENARKVLI